MQRRAMLCSAIFGMALAMSTPAFAQTASTPAARMDIAGMRIGMTEAEARAALRAFDASMRIIRTATPPSGPRVIAIKRQNLALSPKR